MDRLQRADLPGRHAGRAARALRVGHAGRRDEAASSCGGSPSRLIRPTIIFVVIVSTIYGLQIFAEPQLFAGGGPNGITGGADRQFQTLTLYLYEHGFNRGFEFGYASAVAWVMFVIIVVAAASTTCSSDGSGAVMTNLDALAPRSRDGTPASRGSIGPAVTGPAG